CVISFPFVGAAFGNLRQNPTYFGWPGPTSDGPLGRVLRIGMRGDASIGAPLTVTLHGATQSSVVALGIGTSAPGGLLTPLDLSYLGATGQYLWFFPDIGLTTFCGPSGTVEMAISIPAVASLVGAAIPFQWTALEPGANPLGIVVSEAMSVVLVP
ncbi:MAG TPA: hypothetical protein VKE69_01220, partial [Planctomycetota bacterium]|nr:hypothetical protein [Planctomycetota bacterium]